MPRAATMIAGPMFSVSQKSHAKKELMPMLKTELEIRSALVTATDQACRDFLICSSTSLALAGIGVPGPYTPLTPAS